MKFCPWQVFVLPAHVLDNPLTSSVFCHTSPASDKKYVMGLFLSLLSEDNIAFALIDQASFFKGFGASNWIFKSSANV